MFKHLFKLIWNRKRENALIIVELITAFLVVFFIAAMASHAWWLYRQPLGFEWQDTYEIRLSTATEEWTEQDAATLKQVLGALRGHAAVSWAHVIHLGPFRNWRWTSGVAYDGREADTMVNDMTDGGPADLGIELVEGRWFGAGDANPNERAVMINERLRQELFGDASPIGADIRDYNPESEEVQQAWRVVGVFRDFRQLGEMAELSHYVMGRFPIEDATQRARALVVRVAPGTPVSVEEDFQNLIQGIAGQWRVSVTPLEQLRRQQIRAVTVPMTIGSLVAGFLLLMVAFGLFGVLWQNVTRRTDELGLRRAVGATRQRIYRQIVFEILFIALLAVTAGALIGLQFPLLGTFEALGWRSAIQALAIAGLLVAILCALCALYPAWLAARRSPADALHYE